jgi:hypothetical protein
MKLKRIEFRNQAEAAFMRKNPDAVAAGLTIRWHSTRQVPRATCKTELYWVGKFEAIAPGHKPSVMIATGDDDYVMVR